MANPAKAVALPARRDHLWVLLLIAASVLAEVWASWVGIGAMSGFPAIDGVPTDWVLAAAMEAYWGYALYGWLVAAPGPRSRSMAMWSCAAVFILSLISQISYHELTIPAVSSLGRRFVVGFATALPVIVLALIAVLIHLRHLDRAEATAAAEESALQSELEIARNAATAAKAALAETLAAASEADAAARTEIDAVRAELAKAAARAETLSRKLAAQDPVKRTRRPPETPATARATKAELEQQVRDLFDRNPGISIKSAADQLGRGRDTIRPILVPLQQAAHVFPIEQRA